MNAELKALLNAAAEKHQPDGGYGSVAWHAPDQKVFWTCGDWTTNEEIEAARADFLAIDGVLEFESCGECPLPSFDGWEAVYSIAALVAAAGEGIPARVHYRESAGKKKCGTCSYFDAGRCKMFKGDPEVSASGVCDEWTDVPRAVSAALHNDVLVRGYKRADEIVPRLAALLEPLLSQAGTLAARAFEARATDHLTAALVATADIKPSTAMVAIYPRPEEAAALAEDGGELPEDMHVTLAYLGEVDDDTAAAVVSALAPVAAAHGPLEGNAGGVGAFSDNGNGVPAIVLPDVPGLIELRQAVCGAITDAGATYARNHGYQPHLTVAYRDVGKTAPPARGGLGQPLHFDSVRVVRGNKVVAEHPLTGPPALTAAAPPPAWSSPAPDEILDVAALAQTLRTKTDPVRLAVIRTMMDPILEAGGLTFDVTNPLTARVLAQAGSQVVGIAETTQLNVMRIIQEALKEGLSIPDTAKLIRAGMAEASSARATLIARTEIVGAVNGGSLAATQIVSSSTGQTYFKKWLTAPGAKYPRHEDYEGLDGQTVALDATFEVGADQLQFPGDPDGDPEEVCNCRCTLLYTEDRDELDAEAGPIDG